MAVKVMTAGEEAAARIQFSRNTLRGWLESANRSKITVSLDLPSESEIGLAKTEILEVAQEIWPRAMLVEVRGDESYPLRVFRDVNNAEFWVGEHGGRIFRPEPEAEEIKDEEAAA